MRIATLQAAIGSASLFLSLQPASASHSHGHRHAHEQYGRRHVHGHPSVREAASASALERRGDCTLPDHPDLVHVPGALNGGFAMAGDVRCSHGKYCPIACVAGKVMAQWQPGSKYKYPESMNGGLKCNNGVAEKPFPEKPYCVDGTGTVQVVNKVGKVVSFCQTVLPGDEGMVIPTDIIGTKTIAVPGIEYWDKTAAHYYINPPGVSAAEGCIWGTESQPVGNWSPYVAGANTVENGDTYVKIAWNPMFIGCPLRNKKPTYGLKIECPGGGCNGLACSINPSTDGVGGVSSPVKATGVGDANFCVVTVPKGKVANIVVFNVDGSEGPSEVETSTSRTSTSLSTKAEATTSSTWTSSDSSTSSSVAKPSSSTTPDIFPGGIFHENSTTTSGGHSSSYGSTTAPTRSGTKDAISPVETASKNEGAADQSGGAIAGLIVALVAAAALY